MKRFTPPGHAQRYLAIHDQVANLFRRPANLFNADDRRDRAQAFQTWNASGRLNRTWPPHDWAKVQELDGALPQVIQPVELMAPRFFPYPWAEVTSLRSTGKMISKQAPCPDDLFPALKRPSS